MLFSITVAISLLQCSVFAQVVLDEAAYNNDYFYPQENRNINEFLQYPNDEVEQLNLEKDLDTKHDPTFDEEEPAMQQKMSAVKRFTVDFMDMQVSYPQYLRLIALQKKVIKLDQILKKMKQLKPLEELEKMPQWKRLVALHQSLSKLLPPEYINSSSEVHIRPALMVKKQAGMTFNGARVSLPQYMRLKALQDKVLKLDKVMRKLADQVPMEKLQESPKWLNLVEMRQQLQKLLPDNHPKFEMKRGASTMEFNGVQVSYPQYLHLMKLQEKALALDMTMKKIASQTNPDLLENHPTWQKLVNLRESLTKLIPYNE